MVRSAPSSSPRPFVALAVLLAVAVAVADSACAADLRAEGTLHWSTCG